MTYPENYRYTKEHEWVLTQGDTATIGITFHAQPGQPIQIMIRNQPVDAVTVETPFYKRAK